MANLTTTERNGKIAIWITPPEKDACITPGPWNVWDVSKKPTMGELLMAVEHAYELGRNHQLNGILNHLHGL